MNTAEFLKKRHVWCEVIPHHETFSAQRLAHELHVPGREVAKTVLLRANGGYEYFVAVLPANKSLDLKRTSEVLGGASIGLAGEEEIAEHCPDCEVGALPPFGSQYDMKTLVDESLTEDEEIVFEGNTHHEAIRMKFRDFQHVEEPTIAQIACQAS
jgi:Ala-tRNA(Pro) deacylase